MIQIITRSLLIIFLFITSNCGYKVLDNSEKNIFNIKEIRTSGNKRINFKIKNSLIINSSKNRKNSLILELDTKKIKQVKEKNIKNEVTKYEISLKSNIKLSFLDNNKKKEFDIVSIGDYSVADKYSTTLNNEKRIIEDLTNDLTQKIKNKIKLILNDF